MDRLRLTSIIKGSKADLLADELVRANSIMFFELDSNKVKFADGEHLYKDLPYVTGALDEGDGAVYKFKGSVDKFTDLPTENNNVGDCYDVKENGHNYAWTDENDWDDIGGTIDLSGYATLDDLNESIDVVDGKITVLSKNLDDDVDELNAELANKADKSELEAQVASLTQQINALKLTIPQDVFDASTARSAMNTSGKVTLGEDIDLGVLNIGAGIFANNDTYINLNGYNLQAGPTGGRPLLLARGSAKYTFNGQGQVIDTKADSSNIWCASEQSTVTINNGTWICKGHTETIYCELGTIYINGGEFKTEVEDKRYLLNCKDANYQAGKANIIVKGGKFWDFDPHNNTAEGANTNFCADGYTTTSEEIDGHTVYTVVKA